MTIKARNYAKSAASAWRWQERLYGVSVRESSGLEESRAAAGTLTAASKTARRTRRANFPYSMIEVGFATVKSQTPRATVRNRGPGTRTSRKLATIDTIDTAWLQRYMANDHRVRHNRRGRVRGTSATDLDRRHVGKGPGAWGRS